MRFKVGDRVISTSDFYSAFVGRSGTVREVKKGGFNYSVEFDDCNSGHTCDGILSTPSGMFLNDVDLTIIPTHDADIAAEYIALTNLPRPPA